MDQVRLGCGERIGRCYSLKPHRKRETKRMREVVRLTDAEIVAWFGVWLSVDAPAWAIRGSGRMAWTGQ